MKSFHLAQVVSLLFVSLCFGCAEDKQDNAEKKLISLIAEYERDYVPMEKEYNLQNFLAVSTGDRKAYTEAARLRYESGLKLSNKSDYEDLKKIVEGDLIADKLLSRQARLLYYEYIRHQVAPALWKEIVELEQGLSEKFTSFRVELDDTTYSNGEIAALFKQATTEQRLKETWEASKKKGRLVAPDLIRLVKLRNQVAQGLGFDNYFEMQLFVSDEDPAAIEDMYNELDILTRGPYTQLKADIDKAMAKEYNLAVEDLQPWHYKDLFFQSPPQLTKLNYDSLYAKKDVVEVGRHFFQGLGFDVEHLIRNSSLLPQEGKNAMSFTEDIDYNGDVRISMSVRPDEHSMNIFLYELGFGIYLKNINPELPYILRRPSNFFTADAVAILFSSFSTHPSWISKSLGVSTGKLPRLKKVYREQLRLSKFVFSRWAQVMYRFERGLYLNPDQDLNVLWWDLVENYQLLTRPSDRNEADWAAKDHLILMPCKYHNYLLGELFASQLHQYIKKSMGFEKVSGDSLDFIDEKKIGNYFREEIFEPGAEYDWQELIERATGEKLTPNYFYDQFVNL